MRFCQGCDKSLEKQLFPYKTRHLCYECYENQTGKTLNSFRNSLIFKRKYGTVNNFLKINSERKLRPIREKPKIHREGSKVKNNREVLTECINGKKKIKISYKAKYGSRRNRIIQPRSIVGDLVKAYCHFRKEERTFNISKMKIINII